MASCKRAGTGSGSGRRAANARSMRTRQVSSCAPKSSVLAGSSCARSAASFTRVRPGRSPASCALAAHALDFAQGDCRDCRRTRAGGVLDGEVGRHRPRNARSAHPDLQRLERMAECIIDRSALESAMRHAVVAARILADAVFIPLGVLDQRPVARRIAFIRQEIAGPLPTENVVSGVAPGRALIGLIAGEEVQEQRRVIERPLLAGGPAAAAEYAAEQLLAGVAP